MEMQEEQAQGMQDNQVAQPPKRDNLSTITVILITVVATVLVMNTLKGTTSQAPVASQPVMSPTEAVELKQKVEALQKESVEIKNVVMGTIQRLEAVVNGHNSLVKDVQTALFQSTRQMTVLDRTLQNEYGQKKWNKMVKYSDMEIAEEMAAQVKAREEAAVKAKAEEAAKAKIEETKAAKKVVPVQPKK
jgi:hypothetical protein